jgi:nitrite reductase/ring-hydroxylating ferredoxin subunit/uncharacterized membrane protein
MTELSKQLFESTNLRTIGLKVARGIHKRVVNGRPAVRGAVDILHGTWLGHPLHPVLTDVTIGAWTYGSVLGVMGFVMRLSALRRAASLLDVIGTTSAVPTAMAGIADYAAIKQDAVEVGTLHATSNSVALALHLLALRARWQGNSLRGLILSLMGTGAATLGAWLGGEMVYRLRVGVNHSTGTGDLDEWTQVVPDQAVAEGVPLRVEVEGTSVLLYRYFGTVYAINAVCAHAGGPLEAGNFDGFCVTCPWHASVYDVRTGDIVHGPTAFPQPSFEVRVRGGQIEIRATQAIARMYTG